MASKELKTKKKFMETDVSLFIIFALFILLLVQVSSYYKAFHNLDSIYNYLNLEKQFNEKGFTDDFGKDLDLPSIFEITDTGGDMVEKPLAYYYIKSLQQMERSFLFSMVIVLLMGITLAGMKKEG